MGDYPTDMQPSDHAELAREVHAAGEPTAGFNSLDHDEPLVEGMTVGHAATGELRRVIVAPDAFGLTLLARLLPVGQVEPPTGMAREWFRAENWHAYKPLERHDGGAS